LKGLDVREVPNSDWQTGMASSIRAGIEGLLAADPQSTAAVFVVCDQPHVSADVISELVVTHRRTRKAVIASLYGGSFGVPALFSRAFFAELLALEGAGGAKQVIQRHASDAHFLPFRDGEVDVDTPDDYARLLRS
jgi:molybdenum cofactor cytidylyltransferase